MNETTRALPAAGRFVSRFESLRHPEVIVQLARGGGDAWWQAVDFADGARPRDGETVKARLSSWRLSVGIYDCGRFHLLSAWDVEDDAMAVVS